MYGPLNFSPEQLSPPWTKAMSAAAVAEGWEIFDCTGSSCGRWQLDKLDDPKEWAAMNGGVVPPELLEDTEAWAIVANGTQPHHVAARAFLQAHNPQEYDRVMELKRGNGHDYPLVPAKAYPSLVALLFPDPSALRDFEHKPLPTQEPTRFDPFKDFVVTHGYAWGQPQSSGQEFGHFHLPDTRPTSHQVDPGFATAAERSAS